MLNTIRSIRNTPPIVFSSPLPSHIGRKVSGVRFQQVSAGVDNQQPQVKDYMDKTKDPNNPTPLTGDIMSDSFGEGYATRSEEEGFGGIYAGNQLYCDIVEDVQDAKNNIKQNHSNHPEYDKNQGCEVKEKEKARNQTTAES